MQENSPLLQLQNVGYLAGDAKILNNINFSLRAGEFKLITGPSGCGKSTLLKIVASLISPTSGTLLFEGEDVSTLKPEIYRQQVSYCAQTPTLFGDTVYDNLIFPWQIRNQQPDPAIFLDFLERFALPDTILTKNIAALLRKKKTDGTDEELEFAMVQVPSVIPRIVELPREVVEDGVEQRG